MSGYQTDEDTKGTTVPGAAAVADAATEGEATTDAETTTKKKQFWTAKRCLAQT